MAVALVAKQGGDRSRAWPMTREAWEALDAEATRLGAEVLEKDGYATGWLDGDADAPTFIPNVAGRQALRQLTTAREVLGEASVVDSPGLAVIGRRVILEDADGSTSTVELVIPGDGDPRRGRVSADSPVGAAVLGRRVGETVTIQAPAGSWTARIAAIE
ncbi:MAG TPA: GreA/GreB family elongation factor [Candidatus Limnocylindria bacterium]